ncbi:hypothetical protein tloyanaT_13110 [Thalassotalea loyana]|uniref:HeH/LEM domain-containing protein n=1 Tax=Thalassotalea loyana TaxID=280483 RepID=A0ABQ6HBZ6_9GAMM|nr:hypothetical protein [Thalassotalea loyana]GLX85059.1 hypothetical protein tloyanaT_13110 [Thalassotalea loyana]
MKNLVLLMCNWPIRVNGELHHHSVNVDESEVEALINSGAARLPTEEEADEMPAQPTVDSGDDTLESKTNDELKALLDAQQIEYDKKANKSQLIALLKG